MRGRAQSTNSSDQRGFTLLEILAVLVIISIIVSFAGLSLSSRATDERLENEADQLGALLQLAADEAIVQGEEIGLLIAADGYAFYHLEENQWTAYDAGPLRERNLPPGMNLTLASNDREQVELPLPESADKNAGQDKKKPQPQILLLSSGELTPFVLQLRLERYPVYFQAEGKMTGAITVTRVSAKST